MALPDFLFTSTFRLAVTIAAAFSVSTALLFAFIYWQTATFETNRVDRFIADDAKLISQEPLNVIEHTVSVRALSDLHRITFAALFDAEGHRLAGNLNSVPPVLPADGLAHEVSAVRVFDNTESREPVRAVARRLPGGQTLVIGRNIDALENLRSLVLRALALGVAPATLLGIAVGALVSLRAERRVQAVHRAAERILAGDLRERLPVRKARDDFDRLSQSVNHMLDKITRLLDSVKAAGDNIAHDLRTPLTRLRTRLERRKKAAGTRADLEDAIDSAIRDLDQAVGITSVILRIGQIEAGQRRAGFKTVDLSALSDEAATIYEPVCEEKYHRLHRDIAPGISVAGDPDLLMEAIANLIQNAVKFTPSGGNIAVTLGMREGYAVLSITDDGPGIPAVERNRVFERFYRLDKSRNIEGTGLGLSLVAAICNLHGFGIGIRDRNVGTCFEMAAPPTSRPALQPPGTPT